MYGKKYHIYKADLMGNLFPLSLRLYKSEKQVFWGFFYSKKKHKKFSIFFLLKDKIQLPCHSIHFDLNFERIRAMFISAELKEREECLSVISEEKTIV